MSTDPLQRVDRGIWLTIAAVALIDIMAAVAGPFTIAWGNLGILAGVSAVLVAAGYYYRHIRRDERIALLFICNVQIMSFAIVSAALSYVAASAAFPLWDASLTAWDARLGFHWADWLSVMEAHPSWHLILRIAYMTLIAQPVVFIVILAAANQLMHLRIVLVSTIMTILTVIILATFFPAAGPGLHSIGPVAVTTGFIPASWDSWPILEGLRNGTYRQLFTADADGIVTFPSYHAAAGLLGIFAMWPVKFARWFSLILNVAMIAATPVDGGHYIVDVIAGLAVAGLAWTAATWIIARSAAVPAIPALLICEDAPSITSPAMPIARDTQQREPTRRYARDDVI